MRVEQISDKIKEMGEAFEKELRLFMKNNSPDFDGMHPADQRFCDDKFEEYMDDFSREFEECLGNLCFNVTNHDSIELPTKEREDD